MDYHQKILKQFDNNLNEDYLWKKTDFQIYEIWNAVYFEQMELPFNRILPSSCCRNMMTLLRFHKSHRQQLSSNSQIREINSDAQQGNHENLSMSISTEQNENMDLGIDKDDQQDQMPLLDQQNRQIEEKRMHKAMKLKNEGTKSVRICSQKKIAILPTRQMKKKEQ